MGLNLKDKTIFVFGTGEAAGQFVNLNKEIKVDFYLDNDKTKWGSEFMGSPVKSPAYLESFSKGEVYIFISSMYFPEIRKQLIGMGFQEYIHFQYGLNNLEYSNRFKNELKDKHKGERVFLIGNGPSLTIGDLDLLKNEFTFAANKIFLSYENTEWRPTYYFLLDDLMAKSTIEALYSMEEPIFFSSRIEQILDKTQLKSQNVHWIEPIESRELEVENQIFSEELSYYYSEGSTVMYLMIQMAVYMGFEEIYFLGLDFSYNKSKEDLVYGGFKILEYEGKAEHFHPKYREKGEQFYSPNVQKIYAGYSKALRVLKEKNIKVANCSRSTELDIFPRIKLEEIIK
ncbi:6-hydroxymethylpterin diphosphokinase MptE-like protein [Robertmurraya massiliosenegalensis]|uniref:6-hydroxymethylpterin diphosphokinase MptE-like protein n=1 Tax=Robertmurraya massiliosenegalensis TaxID=1287657 RepID=UPI0002F3CC9A|nr:6-hydroxymethylpterin diphosphokinase MptE-like protein [Robertmurraya massiliosenegalensis]